MDFSQLPKMSKTPPTPTADGELPQATPAAARDVVPEARVVYVPAPYDAGFGSVWLSLIAGLIFLAMGQTFGRWLVARASGREFATGVNWTAGPKEGTPVAYFELMGGTAWTDTGLFLMGVALLLDAAILGILASRGRHNRALVLIAVAVTSIAMVINAGVVAYVISIGITLPLTSLIALAVGGFVVFDHAPVLKSRSPVPQQR